MLFPSKLFAEPSLHSGFDLFLGNDMTGSDVLARSLDALEDVKMVLDVF